LENSIDENRAESYGDRNSDRYAKMVTYLDDVDDTSDITPSDLNTAADEPPADTDSPLETEEKGDDYGTYGEDWYIGF